MARAERLGGEVASFQASPLAVCEILAGARTIAFDRAGDGSTRITYTADFKLKGVLRLAEPFLGGTFKTLALKALAGLAAKLGAER